MKKQLINIFGAPPRTPVTFLYKKRDPKNLPREGFLYARFRRPPVNEFKLRPAR